MLWFQNFFLTLISKERSQDKLKLVAKFIKRDDVKEKGFLEIKDKLLANIAVYKGSEPELKTFFEEEIHIVTEEYNNKKDENPNKDEMFLRKLAHIVLGKVGKKTFDSLFQ